MEEYRGSITVEAVLVMPFYILFLTFLANFMNIFYLHQTIQFGLTNAGSVLAQYCYVVDKTIGLENFSLGEDTQTKAVELTEAVNQFSSSAHETLSVFQEGISLDKLGALVNSGKSFASAATNLADKLKTVKGSDLVNYLLASATEAGGGMLIEAMVEDYLDQMKVNRGRLDGKIQYALYLDNKNGRNDMILKASYCYDDPLFSAFTDGFIVEQQVVVHPWIGGSSKGLRGKLI